MNVNESIKNKFNEQLNIINDKLADQLALNKEMLSNDDIAVADYTKYCEDFIDEEIVEIYKRKKSNKRN